jgi:hypothetical protein
MVFDMTNSEHVGYRAATCDGVGAIDPATIASGGPGGKFEVGRARWCSPLHVSRFLVCEDMGRFRPASAVAVARLNFLYS